MGVALSTTFYVLIALVAAKPALDALTLVLGNRATGPDLVPVLQLTGVAELVYAAGIFAGIAVSVAIASV